VQVDDPLRPGPQVQPVHVLSDDAVDDAPGLQLGEGAVPVVGNGAVEAFPSQMTSRPIAFAVLRILQELLEGHGITGGSSITAIVRYPGIGAHPRAGEHDDGAAPEGVCRSIQLGGGGKRPVAKGGSGHQHHPFGCRRHKKLRLQNKQSSFRICFRMLAV